ncbi:intra-flagellar transport protein 57 [Entophlyctis helioformis]|nr:intra-flagellar transport protein 57 [Entophlyctis helioformis]
MNSGSTEGLANAGRSNSRGNLNAAAGGAVASGTSVVANVDDVLDKLKCLGYQRLFCKPNNIRPFHKFVFLAASTNTNEQFFHFAILVSWLMKLCNHTFEPPGQFDDPNAVSANIAAELKRIGIPFEYAPVKLKQAYGDAVIYVLQMLVDTALNTARFTFQKPVHKIDDYPEEAEVDVDAEVTADSIEDETHEAEEEDEMYMDTIQSTKKTEDVKVAAPIKPKVDPNEWRLEVERVTPMLKVQIPNDNKDWRIHLEQINHHEKTINSSMAETQTQLTKLHSEIEKTLEKIASREKYINTHFEPQIEQYRMLQDQTSDLKQKYGVASSNVTELTNDLSRISEELDSVKASGLTCSRMDDLGSGMTDSKPLVAIKQGLARLKTEIKQMDLRIGVIQHTLLHAKLKNKGPMSMLDSPTFSIQILSVYDSRF